MEERQGLNGSRLEAVSKLGKTQGEKGSMFAPGQLSCPTERTLRRASGALVCMVNEDPSIIFSGNSKTNLQRNRLLGLGLGKIHRLSSGLDFELSESPMAPKSAISSTPDISFAAHRKVSKFNPVVSLSTSKCVRRSLG